MVLQIQPEQALARLNDRERVWVESFRDQVRRALGPRLRDLRIFGSKLTGESHDESDIDLLVLVDELDDQSCQTVMEIARSFSWWLEPHVFDFDEYHKPVSRATGFYKEMRKASAKL